MRSRDRAIELVHFPLFPECVGGGRTCKLGELTCPQQFHLLFSLYAFTLYLFGLESRILNRAMQLGQVQQLGPIRGRARVDIKLTRGGVGSC